MSETPILLFVEPPAERRVGGIETALSGLADALRAEGWRVTRREAVADSELAAARIIHFHGLWEPSHAALRRKCRQLGKPVIVSPHGMLEPWAFAYKRWKKWPYFYLRERPGLAAADALLATSEAEAVQLRRWFAPEKIHVLPLGLPTDTGPDYDAARAALTWQPHEFVVLFLSRLHEKKGLHRLIEAWENLVRRTSHPVRLVIAGEGDAAYVDPLKARAAKIPDAQIDWIGPQWGDAKWPWLQGADLFCLPTFSENFGLVVLESLLVGTPVLTTPGTPWGSFANALPITISPPKSPDLTEALLAHLNNTHPGPSQRDQTHQFIATHFAWPRLATQYTNLYTQIASANARPHNSPRAAE